MFGELSYPPLKAPTGFLTGAATTVSCNWLRVVWKDRRGILAAGIALGRMVAREEKSRDAIMPVFADKIELLILCSDCERRPRFFVCLYRDRAATD